MDIVKNLYKKNKLNDIKPLQPTCSYAFIFAGGGSSSSRNKPIFSFPGWGRLGWGDKSGGGKSFTYWLGVANTNMEGRCKTCLA